MSRELRMKSPLEKLNHRAAQLARGQSALAISSSFRGGGGGFDNGYEPGFKSQDRVYFECLEGLLGQYLDEIVDESIVDGVAAA